jgi:uncharacterized protein YkwD
MNVVQYKKLGFVVVLFGLGLVGCGGGGGDSTAPARPAPYVEPVERPAVTQVAAANYADARRLSAFNRVNEVRKQAGIGLLAQNATVDQAAQNHSEYLEINDTSGAEFGHTESSAKPGYTGNTSMQRISAVQNPTYNNLLVSTEVVVPLDSTAQTGIDLVEELMGGPYHREAILSPEFVDIGIGFFEKNTNGNLNINFARSEANTQGAPETALIIWPPEGKTDTPTSMRSERPNPIPENNGAPAGYAASVQVNPMFLAIRSVSQFTIRQGSSTGPLVATKILSHDRGDPNAPECFAAALPVVPLLKNTTYFVSFSGIFRKNSEITISTSDKRIERNWSFTTGNKLNY